MQLSEYDRGFRFKKNVFTVAGMIDRYKDKRIFLYPDHIYSKPWHKRAKSTFVESILLGMPTTEIWCEEDNYGAISVLDGTQRVQCLLEFCSNKFPLQDLKLLPELEESYFSDLPSRHTSTLLNRAELYFTTISYDTHPALKFEFFKRINSDSYRFPVQAARNFAFRDHFEFIRDVQNACSEFIEPANGSSRLLNKNDYLHAASFDELFLLLSALTLTFNYAIAPNKDTVEDLLDDAATHIHFYKPDIQPLKREIRSKLRQISKSLRRVILFDPSLSFNRRAPHRLDDSINITLTSNQVANLYIYALKDQLDPAIDIQELLGSPRASIRSATSYYRRLFR